MESDSYDVIFAGRCLPGLDAKEVRERLAARFGLGQEEMARLFSGARVAVKRSLPLTAAQRYRAAFQEMGALVELRRTETAAPSPENVGSRAGAAPPVIQGESARLSLLPARTGSLIDCAPRIEPVPLPDLAGLRLEPAGTTLDQEHAEPEAPVVDLSAFTLSAANSGSLEDCGRPVTPVRIPDISGLRLADEPAGGTREP